MNLIHKSVLLHETIDGLDIKDGDVVIDGTLGSGGHSEGILEKGKNKIILIGFDLDQDAIDRSKERLRSFERKNQNQIFYIQDSFRNLDKAVSSLGIKKVNKIILDLGLSSNQLEESGRGFTFQKDEPLQMTFSKTPSQAGRFTAYDIVNTFEENNLADIIYGYGEEKFSRRIAKAIVEAREKKSIERTIELAAIIQEAVPLWSRKRKIHPATKTFQALRIAANDELQALNEGLKKGFELLGSEGRMAVISFHSLEDRIVKNFFKEMVKEKKATLFTKKPIAPTREEIKENPRARSSKLRIIIKN